MCPFSPSQLELLTILKKFKGISCGEESVMSKLIEDLYSIVFRRFGFRNLMLFNRARLAKWLWHYVTERKASWRAMMEAKYKSLWSGWCPNAVHGSYRVEVWKNIRRGGKEVSLDL
jgi:hypothetical protein